LAQRVGKNFAAAAVSASNSPVRRMMPAASAIVQVIELEDLDSTFDAANIAPALDITRRDERQRSV
jgi:hypothetical protein